MSDTKQPDVYSRIYLRTRPSDSRNMVIEYLDGGEPYMDEWRLIDLNTGHVYEKDPVLNDVLHEAADLLYSDETKPEYVKEVKQRNYRAFKDIPLKDQLRHIESYAQDLAHDMKLGINDEIITNPVLHATKVLNEMYGYPCFFQEEHQAAGKIEIVWEVDMDITQGE